MPSSSGAAAAVEVRAVQKLFGAGTAQEVAALKGVSLTIGDNEFFTLLGPSGCGKTTLLRLIAGFEQPTEGQILLFGEHLEGLPPNKRPVNTVFQQYALFPHMTVAENVAFGLRMLGRSKADCRDTAERMLALVQLQHLAARRPAQLSGGQQQRVALARALASQPKVLLLDEPLSALDLKLRQEMRVELKLLQEETGITFIFVTHDQEEALTMSDRIAVMSDGEIQQVGTPHEIYQQPVNHFVADFIGETNFLDVEVIAMEGETAHCRMPGGGEVSCNAVNGCQAGKSVSLSVRPEKIALRKPSGGDSEIAGRIERLIYLGTDTHFQVTLDDGSSCLVRVQNTEKLQVVFSQGDRVALGLDSDAARMLAD